ncbi:ABC transporter ATP-binding protein [Wenyingzhuangia sp. IMCC45533]
MNTTILKVENISKQYRLGTLGTGTISHDLNRWWHTVRGKEDPYLKIGESNDRATKGESQYVWSLKDISFEVKKGEVLGIIGKNGAGKSTLLKILSKVTGPTTGSIKTRGRIASLLEVGTGFHPEMTGKENIYLNGAILGMTKKEIASKLTEIIEFSGCERYIDTPVKRYSSGMKVRLAFAVAAFLEPDILVVDEVLAVGDAEFQKKAIGKMQDISNSEGRTVLFVSHDMAAIQSLCTKLLVLSNGKVSYIGNVTNGVDKYLAEEKTGDNLSLLNVNSRKGDRTSLFKSVQFSYYKDKEFFENTNYVLSGEKIYIDLVIQNKNKKKRAVYISIEITDSNGIPVSNISNQFTKEELYLIGDETKLRFQIDCLNFRAMDYRLSFWGREVGGNVFDYIESCATLKVSESDFFNTGVIPRRKIHGYVLLKNKSLNIC